MFLHPYCFRGLVIVSLASVVACAKPAVVVAPVPSPAMMQPLPSPKPVMAAPAVIADPSVIMSVQRTLASLGYDVGKPDGVAGAATRRAIVSFQKDQSLVQDGLITALLVQKLKVLQAGLAKSTTVSVSAGDALYYSDGSVELVKEERVIQWDQRVGKNSLIAVRPSTSLWPSAARAGLDWATSHALDLNNDTPTMWTSTGVDQRFEIRTFALTAQVEALVGERAASCLRYELRAVAPQRSYPGIACPGKNGNWVIARSKTQLARPATTVGKASVNAPAAKKMSSAIGTDRRPPR